jgi:hypothetical protein
MPPKATKDVVSDSTDPATKRPNLLPAQKTGSAFLGMKLPDFSPKINLPSTIQPLDPWSIFRLFISTEMVMTIVQYTNERVSQLVTDDLKPQARLRDWKPVTCEEIYAYIGIRIYMGLYSTPSERDYWSEGIDRPDHPLKDVMSLKRYEAIHARMRIATADPDAEFDAVFERVRIYF